jgi:cell division septation protein DedD
VAQQFRVRHSVRVAALVVAFFAIPLGAQRPDSAQNPAVDSVIARARKLGMDGREAEGRRAIDSLLKGMPAESPQFAEALYARASLATTAVDAERDYRRLLIEAPLAPRAEDALLQLAQLLQARGDRRGASDYLNRFMLTYAHSPSRPRVALSLVRLLFEQGPQQQARACEALRMGREAIPQENLELRNQLEFYAPRCVMVTAEAPTTPAESTATPGTPAAATPVAASAAPVTPAGASSAATAPVSFYSVQIAAYNSREPAVSLVSTLVDRGLEARVDGTEPPFRVRVGKFGTRAEAVKAAATLKSQGHTGFVTLVQNR